MARVLPLAAAAVLALAGLWWLFGGAHRAPRPQPSQPPIETRGEGRVDLLAPAAHEDVRVQLDAPAARAEAAAQAPAPESRPRPRQHFVLRVVDDTGRPIGGLPLQADLVHEGGDQRHYFQSMHDGRALLTNLGDQDAKRPATITVGGPWVDPPRLECDPHRDPSPMDFVVPRPAGLEVVVEDAAGRPRRGIEVSLHPPSRFEGASLTVRGTHGLRSAVARTSNGVARFNRLEPGAWLAVYVPGDAPGSYLLSAVQVPEPGETRTVTVRPRAKEIALVGRLVEDGVPPVERLWSWRFFDPEAEPAAQEESRTFECGPDGAFRLELTAARAERFGPQILLLLAPIFPPGRLVALPLDGRLAPGEVLLGDVVADPYPFAAGTVEFRGGSPTSTDFLTLECRVPPEGSWRAFPMFRTHPMGRVAASDPPRRSFAIEARLPTSLDWRLRPPAPQVLVEPPSILPGSEGVRVVVDAAQRFARGWVRVSWEGRSLSARNFTVLLLDSEGRLLDRTWIPIFDEFELDSVAPPGARLVVHADWHGRPLAVMPVGDGGETEVVLSEGLRPARLEVVDARGRPLAFRVSEAAPGSPWSRKHTGVVTLVLDRPSHDLRLWAAEHGEVLVPGFDGDRRIEVTEPPLEVLLHWEDVPELDPLLRLHLSLRRGPGPPERGDPRAPLDRSGRARLLLPAAGTWHLTAELGALGRRTAFEVPVKAPASGAIRVLDERGLQTIAFELDRTALLDSAARLLAD